MEEDGGDKRLVELNLLAKVEVLHNGVALPDPV